MNLPNDHFLPDDPLFLSLTPEFPECFPVASFRSGIREEFGVDISRERFLEMFEEGDWTIGRFAQLLHQRVSLNEKEDSPERGDEEK
jgi:hypothetical protein